MRLPPALLPGLLVAGPAWAGDQAVSLKPPSGAPVADPAGMAVGASPGLIDVPATRLDG